MIIICFEIQIAYKLGDRGAKRRKEEGPKKGKKEGESKLKAHPLYIPPFIVPTRSKHFSFFGVPSGHFTLVSDHVVSRGRSMEGMLLPAIGMTSSVRRGGVDLGLVFWI